MLQRGVDLSSLDVSYFTSLSYYIMLLFASRGPFSLVFREDTLDESEMMRRQMNPMGQAAGGFEQVWCWCVKGSWWGLFVEQLAKVHLGWDVG